jgi:hypothetical protein
VEAPPALTSGLFQPRLLKALLTALRIHGKRRRKRDVDFIMEVTARLASFGGSASGGRGVSLGLDSRAHRDLCRVMTCAEAEAGDTIVQQGDVADGFYIILQGTCTLLPGEPAAHASKKAAGRPASLLSEGDAFGVTDCSRDGIRRRTVMATSPAILLSVSLVRAPPVPVLVAGMVRLSLVSPLCPCLAVECPHCLLPSSTRSDGRPRHARDHGRDASPHGRAPSGERLLPDAGS